MPYYHKHFAPLAAYKTIKTLGRRENENANTKVRIFDNIAAVICLENIETLLDGEIVRLGVIATNIFEQMENQWLLIHHHGSSISNYIPPNISS
jgi:hypothetical protein